jgi:hypothetical protein
MDAGVFTFPGPRNIHRPYRSRKSIMALQDLRSQAKRHETPEALLEHMQSFEMDLKFTAGIWFFSPFASRFHAKYQDDVALEARLENAATLKDDGLYGLEAPTDTIAAHFELLY